MVTFYVRTKRVESLPKKLNKAASKTNLAVATQVAKDTEPYVPMLTGSLRIRTQVDGGRVIYPGPYARYLYYGKVMKGPRYGPKYPTNKNLVYSETRPIQAGDHWFEKSKAQNLEKWERVAENALKKNV